MFDPMSSKSVHIQYTYIIQLKILNVETGRKASLWCSFPAGFAVSGN